MLGSQPSRTEKMYLRIRPRKKIGIEMPMSDATRLPWSNRAVPLRREEPERDTEKVAKSIAVSASSTVAGKRWPIS